jgi:hypothetical protein
MAQPKDAEFWNTWQSLREAKGLYEATLWAYNIAASSTEPAINQHADTLGGELAELEANRR